jgi:hypothetical protein
MLAGRLLGRVFSNLSADDPLTIDRYEIKHEERTQTRSSDGTKYGKH